MPWQYQWQSRHHCPASDVEVVSVMIGLGCVDFFHCGTVIVVQRPMQAVPTMLAPTHMRPSVYLPCSNSNECSMSYSSYFLPVVVMEMTTKMPLACDKCCTEIIHSRVGPHQACMWQYEGPCQHHYQC